MTVLTRHRSLLTESIGSKGTAGIMKEANLSSGTEGFWVFVTRSATKKNIRGKHVV